jgi:hypothetical protein
MKLCSICLRLDDHIAASAIFGISCFGESGPGTVDRGVGGDSHLMF